jgi:hypothetical protein
LSVIPVVVSAVLVFGGSARASLLQLSSDPFTNSTSQHKTEVEPDTLASGNTWVSTFQVGRVFNGGSSDIGFATSSDGGKTFTHGFLPGTTLFATPAGIYSRVSDPSVAFDAKHGVWLISFVGLFPHDNTSVVDVLVSRSTDGGHAWSNPVPIATDGEGNDKNWTACDNTTSSPFYGHCYTEFDDNTKVDLIEMSTSTDGGSTWGSPKVTANHAIGIGGQPLVQPNGTVIVPIVGFSDTAYFIRSFVSGNGGASWSSTVTVSEVAFHPPAGDLRAGIPLPSAEIDESGKVYTVWSDCRFEPSCSASDLVLSTTTDGIHYSPVTRIPLDSVGNGADHFIPGLTVDTTTSGSGAHLVLYYYYYPLSSCRTSTCQLDVGASKSSDGGATWSPGSQVAGPMKLTWLPFTTQGYMVGDYISTSFIGSTATPAFALASAPTSGGANCINATPNCDEAMFTVQGGVSGAGAVAATRRSAAGLKATRTHVTLKAQ